MEGRDLRDIFISFLGTGEYDKTKYLVDKDNLVLS